MEAVSIIIPVFNKIESTLKCVNSIREFNKDREYEIIVVDNGSTDSTPQVFSGGKASAEGLLRGRFKYIRNSGNLGVSRALNLGAEAAGYGILCFMHNDVFVFQEHWTSVIGGFINEMPDAGVVGLFGAKTMRTDGSFRGKTIVHSKRDNPSMRKPFERVAVVDGMLMAIKKSVFKETGGLFNDFTIHFYDKDLSMRTLKNGYVNYVLNIPFEHHCGTTRSIIDKENRVRGEAKKKFMEIWHKQLPVDVTTWHERISCFFKAKKDN